MLQNYKRDKFGVIHQIESKPFVYDKNYVDQRYSKLQLLTDEMSHLRLGFIAGAFGDHIKSVLDVGYGNGAFLTVCKKIIPKCYGNDLYNDFIPDGCEFVDSITNKHYDLITFFDSLEHFPDISFMSKLKCKYAVVSVPWCHYKSDDWFQNWKHRRPDEHLHHFNVRGLTNFMHSCGFDDVAHTNIEDSIRTPVDSLENILTMAFIKSRNI